MSTELCTPHGRCWRKASVAFRLGDTGEDYSPLQCALGAMLVMQLGVMLHLFAHVLADRSQLVPQVGTMPHPCAHVLTD